MDLLRNHEIHDDPKDARCDTDYSILKFNMEYCHMQDWRSDIGLVYFLLL